MYIGAKACAIQASIELSNEMRVLQGADKDIGFGFQMVILRHAPETSFCKRKSRECNMLDDSGDRC